MTRSSQYLLPGRLREGRIPRDLLCDALRTAGVPYAPFYPHTLPQNPLYAGKDNCRCLPCPNAEACVSDAFWLPHRIFLAGDETISSIAGAIRKALQGRRSASPISR